jgi:hypothetical protein
MFGGYAVRTWFTAEIAEATERSIALSAFSAISAVN